jgi:hypothetical protein
MHAYIVELIVFRVDRKVTYRAGRSCKCSDSPLEELAADI